MDKDSGDISGSREPSRSVSALPGFDPDRWKAFEAAREDCPDCNGTGSWGRGDKCTFCNGTGNKDGLLPDDF